MSPVAVWIDASSFVPVYPIKMAFPRPSVCDVTLLLPSYALVIENENGSGTVTARTLPAPSNPPVVWLSCGSTSRFGFTCWS